MSTWMPLVADSSRAFRKIQVFGIKLPSKCFAWPRERSERRRSASICFLLYVWRAQKVVGIQKKTGTISPFSSSYKYGILSYNIFMCDEASHFERCFVDDDRRTMCRAHIHHKCKERMIKRTVCVCLCGYYIHAEHKRLYNRKIYIHMESVSSASTDTMENISRFDLNWGWDCSHPTPRKVRVGMYQSERERERARARR